MKDAVNEALRDWVTNLSTTHYLVGSAIGPHPFPTIVRDFQKVIGEEIKAQMQALRGKLPDVVVACVGGGSNAIGTFYDFIGDKNVRLIGVEAGGEGNVNEHPLSFAYLHVSCAGVDGDRHSATLSMGQPGVLHGVRTYILQSKAGQIIETHSISAGLDYPGVGPEHAWLKDSGRAEYVVATDEEALRGFRMLTQREGIIPGFFIYLPFSVYLLIETNLSALESSHAIWEAMKVAKTLPKDKDLVVVSHLSLYFIFISLIPLDSAYRDEVTKTLSRFRMFYPNGLISLTGMYLPMPSLVLRRRDKVPQFKCRSNVNY